MIIYNANLLEKKVGLFNNAIEDGKIVDKLKIWKVYSGIIQEITVPDFVIIKDFIKQNFPKLNLTDIDMAINLATANKLEIKKTDESFATFSCSFVGRYLSSYSDLKPKITVDIRQQLEKIETPKEPLSQDEELESFKKNVFQVWNCIQLGEPVFDFRYLIFNYLFLNKIVKITDQVILDSKIFAMKEHEKSFESKNNLQAAFNALEKLDNKQKLNQKKITKPELFNGQAKYVVIEFFKTIDNIDIFLDTITIEKIKISIK